MLHAGIVHSLLLGPRFGIVTTGTGVEIEIADAVHAFLGADASTRFVGILRSGLSVVELQEGEKATVEHKMKATSGDVAALEADVILMGCAGMAGMEALVDEGARQRTGRTIKVVDGARAGVEVLAGLIRAQQR
jgi:Asp/Glu/hydantoin racemase